jgi:predicted TIM-barrel fold metal-dependent hydrolase
MKIPRRAVLAGALAAPLLASEALSAETKPKSPAPRMDCHVHLFGTGDNKSGCRLSKERTEGKEFQILVTMLRLRQRAKTLDEGYVHALAEQVERSGLKMALIYAQDAIYDRAGKPDWDKTPFYVPNDYLLEVVAKHPKMMPCVSINPNRRDAIAELERCVHKGAEVLKIHPPIQGVDLADKKHTKFFKRCADLKTAIMVHTGHEHSAPIFDPELASPKKLELALDQGCTVVACHCGTGRSDDRPDMLPDFLAMVRTHKNLWGDTAVLCSFGRKKDFFRLLEDKEACARLLHGSDFPFPAVPLAFHDEIGRLETVRLQAMSNLLRQDYELKNVLGIGRASAERAYRFFAEKNVQS